APHQFAPPLYPGLTIVPRSVGGVYGGPKSNFLRMANASDFSSGVKSITSSSDTPNRSKRGGLVGNGCVDQAFSPGRLDWGTGRSSIGQIGFPVTRSNVKMNPCFVIWATALIGRPSTLMLMRLGAPGGS